MSERKLFAGAKIKRFRKGLGVTQADMAADLGVSPSYLNLIERDQRPISARVLLALAETYDLDLRGLSPDADERTLTALREAFSDPLLAAYDVDEAERREAAERHPNLIDAVLRLHGAYRDLLADSAGLIDRLEKSGHSTPIGGELPMDEVREALHAARNHFPELEAAAEALREGLDSSGPDLIASGTARLAERHGITVKQVPADVMGESLRRFDRHGRRLLLSEMLDPASRVFQLLAQLALIEQTEAIDAVAEPARLTTPESRRLYKVALANYFAAATMMPYRKFREAAASTRHDLDQLARRFGASFEQVGHRLTTLGRRADRGIPFFMLRADHAGNVSKRYGSDVFPFARSGGTCPRWSMFDAFRADGRILSEIVELPDGTRFLSIARAVRRVVPATHEPPRPVVVVLGCAAEHAGDVVYADRLDRSAPGNPIGVTCRLCDRPDCRERAHPPYRRRLFVDENRRSAAPFAFRPD